MRSVLLDKNAGDKRWRDACRRENLVGCDLLPRGLRDSPDERVLEYAIANDRLLVTFDQRIAEQCSSILAGRNPGLLILRMDDNSIRRISTRTAPKLLAEFKAALPNWHEIQWRHSVVELTPTLVFVFHSWSDVLVRSAVLDRNEGTWSQELQLQLEQNSHGPSIIE